MIAVIYDEPHPLLDAGGRAEEFDLHEVITFVVKHPCAPRVCVPVFERLDEARSCKSPLWNTGVAMTSQNSPAAPPGRCSGLCRDQGQGFCGIPCPRS